MSKIDQIKKIPILDIAGKLGLNIDKNNKSLCFRGHDEKSRSLSFVLSGNYYKCFGCGVKGSTIDLVKEYFNMSLHDALSWIEQAYDIDHEVKTVHKGQGLTVHSQKDEKKTLKSGREYSDIYDFLISISDIVPAVRYLESRGINEEITRAADIRVIPIDNRPIVNTLIDRYGKDRLKESGLMATSKTGKDYFVFFAHRLIIPYFDQAGKIVNLQGRDIDGNSTAKYRLLSKFETTLYNIQNLPEKGTVYLCEGAIDVLSCCRLGLETPIGTPGTQGFKDEYFNLFLSHKVIIASDTDKAGQEFYTRMKKEFIQRKKKIHRLDFAKLQEQYSVHGASDINDIAQKAVYAKKIYSHLVSETYIKTKDGIKFDSGVKYSNKEIFALDGLGPEILKATHLIKKTFFGEVL